MSPNFLTAGTGETMSISTEDQRILLQIARSAIEKRLGMSSTDLPLSDRPFLQQNRGCFVTLEKKGQLRGCIGNIEPIKPLIEAIADNAVSAAFHDPRFSAMTREEWPSVDIEISILSEPRMLEAKNPTDLLAKLAAGVHGVILSRGYRRATFLPQVWDQLPDKRSFLEHLCLKAGMEASCWKDPQTSIEIYEAEHFRE
jgi:AmmeMemoRadiSam system protein A